MREIKFRVWDKKKEIMLPWDEPLEMRKDTMSYGYIPIVRAMDLEATQKNKNKVLLQYTGIKDKNGKEIFEGDLIIPVNMHDANIDFWTNGKGIPQEIKWSNFSWDFPTQILDIKQNWEVIGNIYENSELL